MTANDLATQLIRLNGYGDLGPNVLDVTQEAATMLRQQQDKLTKYELRHAEQRKRIDELETMLRQQQAEIEALKSRELTDEEIRELGRMSRKWQDPYVWLAKRINRPLKDLTDKEIQEVITEHEWYSWTLEQFAKAILRKAQEQ